MNEQQNVLAQVRHYYGEVLKSQRDLKTGACCSADSVAPHLRALLEDVHPEIRDRFYGCGSPLPPALEGCTVLDLGCGTGRDCYLLSRLVGPHGRVIGVDMTPEQLSLAQAHREWHAQRYGYAQSNVEFREGFIEDLAALGIADGSIDVVVSNCVLNLSPEKPRVFAEIFRVLKPGGELYFSDVFADRRVPDALRRDPLLLGECLGGAMYREDFRRVMGQLGCADARTISSAAIALNDPQIERSVGNIKFSSLTIRAFKLALEDRCEDYGQVAYYDGGIADYPHAFELDDHHRLETGKPMLVCGNTADMLSATRYARHFRVLGDKRTHLGLFDCAPVSAGAGAAASGSGACC
jgi:ubiquinone/menaquinone biosynthesis C-methylase UbiE